MVMKNPCHHPDLCTTGAFSSSRSDGVNLAAGLWSLKIKCNQWRPSGAPASSRAVVATSLPARTRAHRWLQLIFKDHQPTGRRDRSSPVASATIESGWRIAHTHNVRRNQSLVLALVGSIVATRRGKYLTRNRGLMVFEN